MPSDDAAKAWVELKAVFKDELTRVLTPIVDKMAAFLNRHPWLVPDNCFMRFLDRVYEAERRLFRWSFLGKKWGE